MNHRRTEQRKRRPYHRVACVSSRAASERGHSVLMRTRDQDPRSSSPAPAGTAPTGRAGRQATSRTGPQSPGATAQLHVHTQRPPGHCWRHAARRAAGNAHVAGAPRRVSSLAVTAQLKHDRSFLRRVPRGAANSQPSTPPRSPACRARDGRRAPKGPVCSDRGAALAHGWAPAPIAGSSQQAGATVLPLGPSHHTAGPQDRSSDGHTQAHARPLQAALGVNRSHVTQQR